MFRTQKSKGGAFGGTFEEHSPTERHIISEFYRLRRTAIKDIAAYLGFLVGFIGSAPFAWGLLAVQLDSGRFARGLWYFFGIVTTAGIFSGIAGMGLGAAAGLLWEQLHRYRRSRRSLFDDRSASNAATSDLPPGMALTDNQASPRLQLVTPSPAPLPNIVGRRLSSVRFSTSGVGLDFSGLAMSLAGPIIIAATGTRFSYPEAGSRDALCSLIDSRVARVRALSGDRIEIFTENGDGLIVPRGSADSTDSAHRRINES